MLFQLSDTLSQKKLSLFGFGSFQSQSPAYFLSYLNIFFHFCLHNALKRHSFTLLLSKVESCKVIAPFFSIQCVKIL